ARRRVGGERVPLGYRVEFGREGSPMDTNYDKPEPTRDEVDALPGPTVLEFGASWCGYCQGAQPAIGAALGEHADVRHIKIGDGRGKPLGRSFGVKLWPTLVFLKDGREVARAVRPTAADEVRERLDSITRSVAE